MTKSRTINNAVTAVTLTNDAGYLGKVVHNKQEDIATLVRLYQVVLDENGNATSERVVSANAKCEISGLKKYAIGIEVLPCNLREGAVITKAKVRIPMANTNESYFAAVETPSIGWYEPTAYGMQVDYLNVVEIDGNKYREIDLTARLNEDWGKPVYLMVFPNSENSGVLLLGSFVTFEGKCYLPYATTNSEKEINASAGNAGSMAAGTRTGFGKLTKALAQLGGNKMPLALSVVYNTAFKDSATYATNIPTYMPKGWNFNYCQYLYADGESYKLKGADFVEYVFEKASNSENKYIDASGSRRTLIVNKDTDGNITGYVVNINDTDALAFKANGMLEKISRKTAENTYIETTLTYSGSEFSKLVKITDGMGRECNISYETGKVTVTKPDGKSIILETNSNNELVKITDVDGLSAVYSYSLDESNNSVFTANGTAGEKICVATDATKRVKTLHETVEKTNDEGNEISTDIAFVNLRYTGIATDVTTARFADNLSGATIVRRYTYSIDGRLVGENEVLPNDFYGKKNEIIDSDKFIFQVNTEHDPILKVVDGTLSKSQLSSFIYSTENNTSAPVFKAKKTYVIGMTLHGREMSSTSGALKMYISAPDSEERGEPIYEVTPKNLVTERKTFACSFENDVNDYEISFDTSEVVGNFSVSEITVSTIRSKPVYYCINKNTGYGEKYTGWYRLDDASMIKYSYANQTNISLTDITLYPADYEKNIENLAYSVDGSFDFWYNNGKNVLCDVKDVILCFGLNEVAFAGTKLAVVSENAGKTYVSGNEYSLTTSGTKVKTSYNRIYGENGLMGESSQVYRNHLLANETDFKGVKTENSYDNWANVTESKTFNTEDTLNAIINTMTYSENGGYTATETQYRERVAFSTLYNYHNATGNLLSVTKPDESSVGYTYNEDNVKLDSVHSNNGTEEAPVVSQNDFDYNTNTGLVEEVAHNGCTYSFEYDETNAIKSVKIAESEIVGKNISRINTGIYSCKEEIETVYANGYYVKTEKDKYDRTLRVSGKQGENGSYSVMQTWFYSDEIAVAEGITDPFDVNVKVSAGSPLRKSVDYIAGKVTVYSYDEYGKMNNLESYTLASDGSTADNDYTVNATTDEEQRIVNRKVYSDGKMTEETIVYDDEPVASEVVKSSKTELGAFNVNAPDAWETTTKKSWETVLDKDGLQRLTKVTNTLTSGANKVRLSKTLSYIDTEAMNKWVPPATMVDIEGNTVIIPGHWEYGKSGTTSYVKNVTYKKASVDASGNETNVTTIATEGYNYNENGNISGITSTGKNVSYAYDKLNRLVRENNQALGKTWTYEYDTAGNILKKKEYNYTNISDLSTLSYTEKVYGYATSGWKDRLTSYDGVAISYDSVGNPLSYKGNLHSWTKGRLLQKVTQPVNANMRAVDLPLTPPCYTSFEYNTSGIRTKKVNFDGQDTITTEYKVEGTTILQEKRHSDIWNTTDTIRYVYNNNELTGFEYNGLPYYYRKNLFGDIIEIYDDENQLAASYTYDAWGNFTVGTNVDGIAFVNKFRYRGYYYDSDTGYYYLQTRYYDPQVGRFISGDDLAFLSPKSIHGLNLYSYCLNNPVMGIDPSGRWFLIALIFAPVIAYGVISAVKAHYDEREKLNARPEDLPLVYDVEENSSDVKKSYEKELKSFNGALTRAGFFVYDDDDSVCHQWQTNKTTPNVKIGDSSGREYVYTYINGAFYLLHYDNVGNIQAATQWSETEVIEFIDANMGTYNYVNPDGIGVIGHAVVDVAPWLILGNTREDPTNFFDRLGMLLGI